MHAAMPRLRFPDKVTTNIVTALIGPDAGLRTKPSRSKPIARSARFVLISISIETSTRFWKLCPAPADQLKLTWCRCWHVEV